MQTITEMIDTLHAKYPQSHLETRVDGFWLEAQDMDVVDMAGQMAAAEVHLSTVSATALPDDETELIYHYRKGSAAANIKTRTKGNSIPSIAPVCRAASWIEREIQDLYAVTFTGHPNPARLIRPPELAAGFFREPAAKNMPGGKSKPGDKNPQKN